MALIQSRDSYLCKALPTRTLQPPGVKDPWLPAYLASSTRYTLLSGGRTRHRRAQTYHPPDPKRMGFLTAHRARDDAVQENPITIRTLIACSHHALPQPKAGLLSGKNLWWGAVSQTSPVVGTLQRPASEQSVTCPSP